MSVLVSARLLLREMTGEDLDFVAGMLSDPEVMRYYPKVLSREEAREWIARQVGRYRSDGHGLWLAETLSNLEIGEASGARRERSAGLPIGQVGLIMQDVDGAREPEIGYLIHPRFWRRGYAAEAALAVRGAAFGRFGFDHAISLIRPENIPSQRVAARLGMAPIRETVFRGLPHLVFRVERGAAEAGSRNRKVTDFTG